MANIKKIRSILTSKQKRGVILLAILVFLSALLEMFSVSMLIPVISALLEPDRFLETLQSLTHRFPVLSSLGLSGDASVGRIAKYLILFLVILFIVKNIFALYLIYRQNRFVNHAQNDLATRLLQTVMSMPYEEYLSADLPALLRLINEDVANAFVLLRSIIQIIIEFSISLFLCALLFFLNPLVMTILVTVMMVITFFNSRFLKRRLNHLGKQHLDIGTALYHWRTEAIYGYKDIYTLDRKRFILDKYYKDGALYADTFTKYNVLNNLPRYLIETAGMTSLLVLILLSMNSGASSASLITLIGVIGVASMKMLPGVNRINTHLAEIAYREPGLNNVYEYLCHSHLPESRTADHVQNVGKLTFSRNIQLSHISYAYPGTDKLILDDVSMEFGRGQSVGIKGISGAGKSTIVDILLGLLRAQKGTVLCDGKSIFDDYPSWLAMIGYIPQSIYLVDRSIRENIAYAIDPARIDDDRIWDVLSDAQLDTFVRELPDGLDTEIGDRGIRISGGQRQRIGIARALYHDPEILIFDEATSALDNETESALMDAINTFHGKKTMVIIAHRLNTIENCDMIYEVTDGKLMLRKGSG